MRLVTVACIALISLMASAASFADQKVIWECRTSNPSAKPILYLVEWGERSYIKFSYMRFAAHYEEGDDYRAWHWHNDGSGYYRYGLTLGSDNRAWYHNFRGAGSGGEAEPLDFFICQQDQDE